MKEVILEKLKTIEYQFDVKILYACESGSRAWGFASPDSDFDVRFIYVHKRDYYLSIDEQRDVIELPINEVLDINGWELRKALKLFRKSNGPLYEWLQSSVVYFEDRTFAEELRSLMPDYFSSRATMHHYLSMAKGVFENELSGEKVKLKKYFYALRPVLAAMWTANVKSVPPMDLASLRKLMPQELNSVVNELLIVKAKVDESFLTEKYSVLDAFIADSMRDSEAKVPAAGVQGGNAKLNELFKKYIV
jgi:uncharacterized protein